MLIYFCSGVCSLIDEVVWVRLLKLTLGNTVYASSIVVSVFMGGLALGALVMGRYADQVRRRLRLYALLEVIAALSALSLPWILQFADGAYRWFFVKYQPLPAGLLAVQVIISAGVLLVPTMVMGSTLPLLGRYVTALQNRVGPLVGRLYALNMLGAALGCFLAGFVLIRTFGVMGALYIAAGINMLVAFGGWILSRFYDVSALPAAEVAAVEKPAADAEPAGSRGVIYLLMTAFFLSGLISIGYELIWMRSIVFLLGGYTYVFSAVLTVYLLGNVLGAWLGTKLSKRLKNPATGFAVSLSCLGVLGIFYIPWLSMWHLKIVSYTQTSLTELLNNSVFKAMVWPFFQSIFLFLLPAVVMGIGFPLALQAWGNLRHKVGQTTAAVYGVNTIGAVLGGLATGFLLIPLLGVQLSITVLGLTGIWLGFTMIQAFTPGLKIVRRLGCLTVALVLTVTAVIIPSDLFERQLVQRLGTKLLAIKEAVTTTVSIHEDSAGTLMLATSGIQVAGDSYGLQAVQKMLGHLGLLLNENTKRVLSVGFGAGQTTACMSLHSLERIDGVEISPELTELALQFFPHINLGERLDEKVNMYFMDAKNYLHLSQSRYDLIINDCIDPKKFAENASLFTREYFQSALEHLNPGGTFGTYLPYEMIPKSCIDSILGTFADVFPNVTIWFPVTSTAGHLYLYLAGSGEPQLFSPKHIDELLRQKGIGESAGYINFYNSHYVLSCYIADQDDLKKYLNGFHLNSDFKPYVEFNTDFTESSEQKAVWLAKFTSAVRNDGINSLAKHIDFTEMTQDEQDRWNREFNLFYEVSNCLLKSSMETEASKRLLIVYDGIKLMPEHKALLEEEDFCLCFLQKNILNKALCSPDIIEATIRPILQSRPDSGAAWLIKSWMLQRQNEPQQALSAAEKAVEYAPYTAVAHSNLGRLLLKAGQAERAIDCLNRAVQLRPNVAELHFDMGTALARQGRLDLAISHFYQGLRIRPRNIPIRYYTANLLYRQGKKDEAAGQFRKILQLDPTHQWARNDLNALLAQ